MTGAAPGLPPAFRKVPLAHRALHDLAETRPENSRAAVRAAIAAGYGIEIDLQLSSDGQAMVFHDYALDRLTAATGPVRARTAAELGAIALAGGDGETVPTLREVLDIVAGQVPLLIEIKDQDGAMGPDVGPLETAAAQALAAYRGAYRGTDQGDVAVMSFNPHSVAALARHAPGVPRGLTTAAFDPADWPLPAETCARLRESPDFDRVGACFISHEAADLARPRVARLRAAGQAVLCWTIRSQAAETAARRHADNITFEGYLPARPA